MPDQAKNDRLRERERAQKRRAREDLANQTIPKRKNPRRRRACEKDIFRALQTYFPAKFYHPFSADQREMIDAILYRAKYGGNQAIAAPRGGGKTTITTCVVLLCVLYGWLKFPLIIAATGPKAKRILRNMKQELRGNDLLLDDFPEVCHLVRYVAPAPNRTLSLRVDHQPVEMVWRDDHVILPTVKGSKASGAILSTVGITGDDIRGLNVNGVRPDLVILDDVDTRESAASDEQTQKRELTIEQDVAGLGGPGKSLACVMLCTCINGQCLAYIFTDLQQKPSWHGKRYKALITKPDREDLWETYVYTRLRGMETGKDPEGREAQRFYLGNRVEMDAGADVANPFGFVDKRMPDGTQAEVSALQHCYNRIADGCKNGKDGWIHFATEFQNEPPEADGPLTSGITAAIVVSRVNGLDHRQIPDECTALTACVDLGHSWCHWVVTAWTPDATGFIADYGTIDVRGVGRDSDQQALERALISALRDWRTDLLTNPYRRSDGEPRPLNLVLIDSGSGLHTAAVYSFCRQVGGLPFVLAKGFGDNWSVGKPCATPGKERRVGTEWALQRFPVDGIWLFEFGSTHWRKFVHERFLTPTFDDQHRYIPGSLSLFACPDLEQLQKDRREFSHQIVAEIWSEHFVDGKGWKRGWHTRGKKNHWLDATAGACVAANMVAGISLVSQRPTPAPRQAAPAKPKPSTQFTRANYIERPGGWIEGMRR